MRLQHAGSCDECGTNTGPFVHFGGGTMASEDCLICMPCIYAAYRSTHLLTMVNGPMAGMRMDASTEKMKPFVDTNGRVYWYELSDWSREGENTPHCVWLFRGETDSYSKPPEVKR
jgi:hypothetical protein